MHNGQTVKILNKDRPPPRTSSARPHLPYCQLCSEYLLRHFPRIFIHRLQVLHKDVTVIFARQVRPLGTCLGVTELGVV